MLTEGLSFACVCVGCWAWNHEWKRTRSFSCRSVILGKQLLVKEVQGETWNCNQIKWQKSWNEVWKRGKRLSWEADLEAERRGVQRPCGWEDHGRKMRIRGSSRMFSFLAPWGPWDSSAFLSLSPLGVQTFFGFHIIYQYSSSKVSFFAKVDEF